MFFLVSTIKDRLIHGNNTIKIEKNRKTAIKILDKLEEFLEEKDITIPNDDREENQDEARIYGSDYYDLEDVIVEILNNKNT